MFNMEGFMKKYLAIILVVLLLLTGCGSNKSKQPEYKKEEKNAFDKIIDKINHTIAKPVIYLYPSKASDITVKLNYNGELKTTYPKYNGKWQVKAYPNGNIINSADNKSYSYLFWEGNSDIQYDFSTGFVVKGEDTVDFLQETLSKIGLNPKEYNEFIVYWLPKMQDNTYNLISFQGDNYTENAELIIDPQPDSLLRVFMAYKALDKAITIEEQNIKPFVRNGFTVVEWGGCEVK